MQESETLREADEPEPPLAVAVVLTWNDVALTRACLASLMESTYPRLEVILVDNGSQPPTIPVLGPEFPRVRTLALDQNYGFTGGNNRGMALALEMGAEYVFMLNNDTRVHPDAVGELVKALEERPDAGMASALLFNPGEPRTMQPYEGRVHVNRAWVERPGEGEPFREELRRTYETEFVSGCAVLLRAGLLRKHGMLDDGLFVLWEDYDLCLRYGRLGLKILMVGTAEVEHRRHETTGTHSPFILYFNMRNRLICLFRYGSLPGILRASPRTLNYLFWKQYRCGITNWPCHAATLRGVLSFLLGIRGAKGAPKYRKIKKAG